MRILLVALTTALTALLAVGCGIPEEQYVKKVNEVETLRQDLDGARGQLRAMDKKKADLERAMTEKGALSEQLVSSSKRVEELENTLAQRGRTISDLSAQVKQLEEERASLSKKQQKLLDQKRALEEKTKEYDTLVDKMKEEIDAGKIEISNLRGRMAVKLKDKVLFASGSARIQDEGKEALTKLAEVLKTMEGRAMRVEGHTDNVPVSKGGQFASNWELSSARALAVVKHLQKEGVDPSMLSAEGCGQFQPIGDNESPEGRSQNRRIEIVLVKRS